MPWQEVHGIFLLNKPRGITSNSALQKVRRIFNAEKAGHTGSLDPMATGLLPCCFGDATKIAGLMLNSDKEYIATCQVGHETDTGDRTGKPTVSSAKTTLNKQEILHALQQLTGPIDQIPPMYSALHHKGQRLYDLARKGIEVERPPRRVTIHEIELLDIAVENNIQSITLRAKVSKGTYIRTLLEDMAKLCGSYAHMTQLHRSQLGMFSTSMYTLDELQAKDNPFELLETMDIALTEYPRLCLNSEEVSELIFGRRVEKEEIPGIYRIYDPEKHFVGMGESLENGQFRVKKLFLKSYNQTCN